MRSKIQNNFNKVDLTLKRTNQEYGRNVFFNPHKTDSFFSQIIQPNLKVSRPGDKYDQEAIRVADAVTGMPDQKIQLERLGIQCKCKESDDEKKLQIKPNKYVQGPGSNYASSKISSKVKSKTIYGSHLPRNIQTEMGNKMGADFSEVNIHTDSKSHQLNQQLGAKAFTHGSDIYFNKGEYNPNSNTGKRLLAHELTHVIQQQGIGPAVLQKQESESETHIIEDDATIDVPAEMTEEQLRQIIHNHPVIGRRLIYRSDEGEHSGDMLQEHSNVSEVYSQIFDRHGPVRLRFRFTYVPVAGTDGWRVSDIEIEVRDQITFEEGDTVAPNPPNDLQERINRQSPPPPDVNLPPRGDEVWNQIRKIFWDPENATPTNPGELMPSMPNFRAGLKSVIQNNLRNLRNADAIQRSGADYLGYADALARWATGIDIDDLAHVPADIRERVMERPLSLEGYRTGAARAIQMISRISPDAQLQGARHAIRELYGHTRARIREGLLQQTTSDMSDQLRALMPVR